jgi:hypothetical protein
MAQRYLWLRQATIESSRYENRPLHLPTLCSRHTAVPRPTHLSRVTPHSQVVVPNPFGANTNFNEATGQCEIACVSSRRRRGLKSLADQPLVDPRSVGPSIAPEVATNVFSDTDPDHLATCLPDDRFLELPVHLASPLLDIIKRPGLRTASNAQLIDTLEQLYGQPALV